MRAIAASLTLAIVTGAAWSQQPAPPTKTYSSAADVAALRDKAKAEH